MDRLKSNERIRFRYGICLNENCDQCKKKEVMEIPARKDFVCPECGKPLRECPAPRRRNNKKIFAIVGVVALLALGVALWLVLSPSSDESLPPKPIEVAQKDGLNTEKDSLETDSLKTKTDEMQHERDSLQAVADSLARLANQRHTQTSTATQPMPQPAAPAPRPAASPAPVPKPVATAGGTKDLGYATFKGSWPNDVNGRMVFKTSHVIDSRDPKKRVAESGDYVIGEFSEGHLVQGIWYGADNQVKGSIIIGK